MPLPARRHIPNILTVLRLFFAAAFFFALEAYQYPDQGIGMARLAVGLFIIAAVTDALDGYLARRWNAMSTFGRLMDPFCDKILILGAFVYLAGPQFLWPGNGTVTVTAVTSWMVAIILARELLVTAIRGLVESQGVTFGSMLSGKLKMILQSFVVPIVLVVVIEYQPHEASWAMWTCRILIWLTVVVTIWSGIPYVMAVWRFANRPVTESEDD